MKILIDGHMLGQNEGGNERYTKNIALALLPFVQVSLLVYNTAPLPSAIKQIRLPPLDILRFFITPFILIRHKYDILHSNYLLPFWKPFKIKYVVTIHDVYFRRAPETYSLKDRILFFIFLPYSLWLSDVIVVPSKFTRKEFIYFYPEYADKVFVTGEGVDPLFHPLRLKRRPFYLAISSKSARKNIQKVCDAFEVSAAHNLFLYVVGRMPRNIRVHSPRIKYLGYVSDKRLNRLYNETRALVYVSSYEGFGLPPLEALACGTAVMASSIPCIREVCGANATYFDDNEIPSIFGRNTEKLSLRLNEKYTWKKAAKKTIKAYGWAVNGKEVSRRQR